ncbi:MULTISPECIES: hypothetical protein [Burkholderia]|uniref:hypothetical protein n=1 Tax=Burkholderia TaxID=32008 RepID=UPI000AF04FC0|nr:MULTISPECIES: hypothetical protein [Burkholderia]
MRISDFAAWGASAFAERNAAYGKNTDLRWNFRLDPGERSVRRRTGKLSRVFSSIAAEADAHLGKAMRLCGKESEATRLYTGLTICEGGGGLLAGFDVNTALDRIHACSAQTDDEGAAMPHKHKGEMRRAGWSANPNPDSEQSG